MANIKEVEEQLEGLTVLETLAVAYQEIAASRMRQTRSQVLKSRDFLLGLGQVFIHLKSSYQAKIAQVLKKGKIEEKARQGKTAHVLISANTGFYGDIVNNTYRLFIEGMQKDQESGGNVEAVIIGRRGLLLFEQEAQKPAYTYFDLPDHKLDTQTLAAIVKHLSDYERVFVYYGKFDTLVSQVPQASSISGDEILLAGLSTEGGSRAYIFEPSIQKLMAFFKSEISASLFEQTVYESQLAKFASRMVSLDLVLEQVAVNIQKTRFEKERVKRRTDDRKQLSLLSGMSLWG